jgi:hypothetical protein
MALTDALIFLLILSVTVSISLLSAPGLLNLSETYSVADMKDYAEDTFIVLLRSTLSFETCGMNLTQALDRYILSRTSAEDSLLVGNQSVSCDLVVHEFGTRLILERYRFILSSTYLNETSGRLTEIDFASRERASGSENLEVGWTYPMSSFGKQGEARISLAIWLK